MSGTSKSVQQVWPRHWLFDGLLWGTRWAGNELRYAFPDDRSEYAYGLSATSVGTDRVPLVHKDLLDSFSPITTLQERAVAFALDADMGRAASAGFSVEGFTRLDISEVTAPDDDHAAHLRFANTASPLLETAKIADFLGGLDTATADDDGDIWFGPSYAEYLAPRAGNLGGRRSFMRSDTVWASSILMKTTGGSASSRKNGTG